MSTFAPRAWYKPRNEWVNLPGKIQEDILCIKSLCGENATLELGQNWDAMITTRPGGKRVNVTDSIVRWESDDGDPDAALIEFHFFHKKVEFMGYKMPLSLVLERGLDKEAAIEWLAAERQKKEAYEHTFRKAEGMLLESAGEITGLSVWAVRENSLFLKYYGDVRNCEFTVEGIKEAVASFNIKRVRREFSSYSPKPKPKPKPKLK